MIKLISIIFISLLVSCGTQAKDYLSEVDQMNGNTELDSIVLGGGCFWCVEAIYLNVKGVLAVESGYTGGKTLNPTYRDICTGTTGHAEVVKITYDPRIITLNDIFEIFFATHDPTTLNRQGADVGTQYRSAIFYSDDNQKELANQFIALLTKENVFSDPIVTEITKLGTYYVAEDYHQNYYYQNSNQPYCRAVINPKIDKLNKILKAN